MSDMSIFYPYFNMEPEIKEIKVGVFAFFISGGV